MFDIQDEKFNETIIAVEPNLVPHYSLQECVLDNAHCGDPSREIDAINEIERKSVNVLELYCDEDHVMITKREAELIAKHFGIIT